MTNPDLDGRITAHRQGHLHLIGLDRPKKLNAFTPKMLDELAAAYDAFESDPDARAAVLFAHGDHFTAGLDLPKVAPRLRETGSAFLPGAVDPLDVVAPYRSKPVVAAVRGYCYTIGIELMLAADVVVAGAETRFRQHEVGRGIMAGGGATFRFVERAGWGNAMMYLLTGDEFGAEEARRIHFVQEVVETGRDIERATQIATRIAEQAPLAVAATRVNARLAIHAGREVAIADINARQAKLSASEDAAEGLRSFVERRAAQFRGR
jgi:enoyl-CoA hydratase/carnithine racemase